MYTRLMQTSQKRKGLDAWLGVAPRPVDKTAPATADPGALHVLWWYLGPGVGVYADGSSLSLARLREMGSKAKSASGEFGERVTTRRRRPGKECVAPVLLPTVGVYSSSSSRSV
jgi:hypothetical protein